MKTQKLLITLTTAAALTFIVGCDSKPADPLKDATNAVTTAVKEATKAVEAAPAAAEKAMTDVKAAVTGAAADAKAAVTPAANGTVAKVNGIIDQAKALIGQNKYTEALTSLQSLAGTTLNADQDKIVAGLKDQITKAMAAKVTADPAGAVNSLLKK